jgi:hypothetical protein
VIGALILCVLVYIAFLVRRQHKLSLAPVRAGGYLPELGPGLTPEMDGRSRPTELPTGVEWNNDKKRKPHENQSKGRDNELQG